MSINLKHQWISNPATAPTKADQLNAARLAQLIATNGQLAQELR